MLKEELIKEKALNIRKQYENLENEFIISVAKYFKEMTENKNSYFHLLKRDESFKKTISSLYKEILKLFSLLSKDMYNSDEYIFKLIGKEFVKFDENTRIQILLKRKIENLEEYINYLLQNVGYVDQYNNFKKIDEIYNNFQMYYLYEKENKKDEIKIQETLFNGLGNRGLVINEEDKKTSLSYLIFAFLLNNLVDINRDIANENGKQYGANGMQISRHDGARPTHR